MVPTIEKTPDNHGVIIFRLVDGDPDIINFNDIIKAFYMCTDIRLVLMQEVWQDGEILIFDMTNIALKHFTKLILSTLRLFMKYSQEAHPAVVQQIHIINCSSLINRVMMVIKPFLKAEIAERIQTHLPDSDTLFKYIPRDILPKEYGGHCGSIETTRSYWLSYLESYRSYVMDDDQWRLKV